MKLLQSGHVYSGDFEVDEGSEAPRFHHSNFIFVEDYTLFYAQSSRLPGSYDISSLDVYQIPLRVFPERSKIGSVTLAPDPPAETHYIKFPNLIQYPDTANDITADRTSESMVREIQVCEILRRHPHPNVSEYLGCSLQGGRILALHFVKYPSSLTDRMRRGSIMEKDALLKGIRLGLEHLHKLGYCHNDLKPSNVMLKLDGTPVIIDYDSCQPARDKLVKGGTLGWNHASYSSVENDWACLSKIAQMLGSNVI